MLSVNALIGSLIKRTPFRKQDRVLKINLIVEKFFRSTKDVEEARGKPRIFCGPACRNSIRISPTKKPPRFRSMAVKKY